MKTFQKNSINLKEPYIKLEHENGDIFQFNFKDFDNLKKILNTIFGFYRMQFCLHYWCYLDDENSDYQALLFTDDAEVISMGEIYNYDLSKELPKFDYSKNIAIKQMYEDIEECAKNTQKHLKLLHIY